MDVCLFFLFKHVAKTHDQEVFVLLASCLGGAVQYIFAGSQLLCKTKVSYLWQNKMQHRASRSYNPSGWIMHGLYSWPHEQVLGCVHTELKLETMLHTSMQRQRYISQTLYQILGL